MMQEISKLMKKFGYISFLLANLYFLGNQFASGLPNPIIPGGKKNTPAKISSEKESPKTANDTASKENKELEAQIVNAVSITTDQLVAKPQDYLNKDIKFTAKFASFSSLALDYKPAFRSARNYLSFLVFRPDTHIPFSEIKLAMPIPKEKDPETHMLQTLKEGDTLEIYGRVFACPLDEPWVDVLKIKKIASSPDKAKVAEDKDAPGDEDSPTENKHE